MPKVNVSASYINKDLTTYSKMYRVIDDVLDGSLAVKRRRTLYLPMPNPGDDSEENKARYDAYLTRAVFYAVTRRVLEGFVGEIFDKDPTVTAPDTMKTFLDDATGEGIPLTQVAKLLVRGTLGYGRYGAVVDYPDTKGATTKADLGEGVQPVVKLFHPTKIINWRHKKMGAKRVLSLVVIEEEYDKADNGFETLKGKQWRVLRLNNDNVYTVEYYRDESGSQMVDGDGLAISAAIIPTDADGKPFNEIAFKFLGAETNDAEIDYPPLYDMADLNLAHFRNSADYEEVVYIVGQPTPVISGLSESWAEKYFGKGIGLGSRAAMTLPVGATAELLQVTETTMAKEAMDQKERQMVALGAKLVEQKSVQRTATEAGLETASEKSVLTNIADNVSSAVEWMLYFAARFMGVPADGEGKIVFRLNKEFSISFNSPEARKEAIEAWASEAISFTEMRSALRSGGLARLPDEQARTEIGKDRDAGIGPINPANLLDKQNEFDKQNNDNPDNKPGDE